ncbi:MAG: efflux RND transporter permease subunit [Gemmatimonadota bacterium]
MIDLSIRRPVATACLYIALLALGAYSFRLIPLELLPEVSYPRLTVTASWRGASPEAMEAFVTAPLEAAVEQVGGVRKVSSVSRADRRGASSRSEIDVEFARATRMEFARLELGERLAALQDELPVGVRPSVSRYVPPEFAEENRPFLSYQLSGPYTFEHLGELADREVRPLLLAVDGVSQVRVYGGEEREIEVLLDRGKLEALGLRPEEVAQRILDVSLPRAPGAVELAGQRMALAVRTRVWTVPELSELVVAGGEDGPPVRVGEIGRVRERTAEPSAYHRIDGQPTVSLIIYRQAGTNAVRLADAIKGRIVAVGAELPAGARLELDEDESREIRTQLTDLRLRAAAAAVVIFLVLMLFLQSLGAVLVVFATIAFSVLIAVNFLYLGGFSLNVLTLAGLAWGFGLVVDNGIVVLENVERHRRGGKPRRAAAREGARQVVLPVLAATFTTAIVLVPFLFLQGELRLYYLPLAYAVGFSILASLFVAFTFVPALAARLAPGPAGRTDSGAGSGSAEGRATGAWGERTPGTRSGPRSDPLYLRAYRALLSGALNHPLLVAFVCFGSLGGSWMLFDDHVNRGVRWSDFWGQRTYIDILISFPRGAGLERTDELARSFEAKLATLPEVARYESNVLPQFARIRVTFPEELETTQVPVAIKEQMVAYSYGFSGVQVRVYGYGPSFYGGGGSPPNYRLKVYGYNYLTVRDIAEEIASRLERFSRIRDVDPNASGWYEPEKEFEYYVAPDRAALGDYGLTVQQLLAYVASNVRGAETGQRFRLGPEEMPLSVKVAGYREFDLRALERLQVPVAPGRDVRLASVADVGVRNVLASIRREDQQYERTVAWEFRGPRKLGDLVRDAVVDAMELPPGYRVEEEERWRWSEEEQAQVYLALGFSILLVYMVTAALFESLAAPFVVLLTLPLALIGVFLIFFYTNATFTDTAYIGTIMMGGIVVNNAILIVYHIGELRRRMETRAAILQGTLERVRPIMMTSLTTVLGLLPLVLLSGSDDTIWNALALATIGGLLSSTLFVLVAIPVAYRWLVARRT